MIVKISPTRINLVGYEGKKLLLQSQLTYINKSIDYQILKFKKNGYWFIRNYGKEEYDEKLASLKSLKTQCLLFEDDSGFWTYSGLASFLSKTFSDTIVDQVEYPEPKLIPFECSLKHPPRPYQDEAVKLLVEAKHGAIEYGTGAGKSQILAMLCKYYGLKTVISTPSVNIANQIYNEFIYLFGKKYVGKFYGGKKESNKLFIIAVTNSLVNVEKGDSNYEDLLEVKVICLDEAHRSAADTLSTVFTQGPLKNAPYRFSVSGTQFRHDGKDLLLDSIIGPIVKHLSVKDLVDQNYLAKPEFRMVWVNSDIKCASDDPKKLIQAHVYKNPEVAKIAAGFIEQCVNLLNKPTIVLIEEFSQFQALLPFLTVPFRFCHSGATKDNKGKIPAEYHKSDVDAFVKEFNEGKVPLLIGTDCITTGTDMPPTGAIIYLKGISSPIDLAQAVGRGTRKVPGKDDFLFIDIGIKNVPMLLNQAKKRIVVYNSIYDNYDDIDL